ncbi:ABC transporter ATP-binding protein [Natronoglycomyces albus]|uniref:ABC transporter ATP-binding protein n=1 Tax=Natronoglycomyces albus TaxID=2811108 RepID=A0A895XQU8_9ACTN|nr:ABC transporter ATP-binding protein [Natronoglycomyces albus]QSB05535.1 ABC transporter ATP-binding protein [Natronoglycomyces albus]
MTPAATINHLNVDRGGRPVLRALNTHINTGSITGLLGPSGSGKTTLIRAIVGVQKIRSGSVSVFGLPAGSTEVRRRVGYVTQHAAIYPDLTVEANVRYFAALYGANTHDADRAITEVGMTDHAKQLAANLSGGQKTRTSLACALVTNPEMLVLDEPTVGLDPVLREELWDQFRALAASGKTLVISSHVMDEAERCDRLLLLRQGRFLADDTPQRLLETTGEATMDQAFLFLVRQRATEKEA